MSVVIRAEDKVIACKYCGSNAVVKFGSYKGIPRYWCKSCQRKFKADDTMFKVTYPPASWGASSTPHVPPTGFLNYSHSSYIIYV